MKTSPHQLFYPGFESFRKGNIIHIDSVCRTVHKGVHIPLCNPGRRPLGGGVPHQTSITVTTSLLQLQTLFNYPRLYLLRRAAEVDESASEGPVSYDRSAWLSPLPFKQQLDRICEARWACIVLLSSKGTEWG